LVETILWRLNGEVEKLLVELLTPTLDVGIKKLKMRLKFD
jgi:hypothetical protein